MAKKKASRKAKSIGSGKGSVTKRVKRDSKLNTSNQTDGVLCDDGKRRRRVSGKDAP